MESTCRVGFAKENVKRAAPYNVQPSRRKLLHEVFYLSTVGSSTYAESRPTPGVLRVGHNALDVFHVWTWAVYGLMHAHEGVLAEIFRAGNCHREEQTGR